MNPLTRLKSTLSTVTSTLQAVRELPGVMKEAIAFARENSEVRRELEAANVELDKGLNLYLEWMNRCITLTTKLETVRTECQQKLDLQWEAVKAIESDRDEALAKLARYEAAETTINHLKSALNRDKTGLALALCNIREHVNGCKWIPDGENASYSYDEMSEETIRKECGYIIASVDQIAEKALLESGALATSAVRDELTEQFETMKTKLARYEAAEMWHQVTAGEGELPPAIPVLWRDTHPDHDDVLIYCIKGARGTYEWRYLSGKDVPC